MRACSSASGGVMFIPDTIEETTDSVSYKDLVKDEDKAKKAEKPRLFGRKKADKQASAKAA